VAKSPTVEELRDQIRGMMPLLRDQYGVDTLALFGSYVRQEESDKSDLDVLVSFRKTPSLFSFVRLENYLSDELGLKVDLVMKNALKPGIGRTILREAIAV